MGKGRKVYSSTTNSHFNKLVIKNGRRSFPSSTTPSLPSSPVKKRNCTHLERDNDTAHNDVPYIDYAPPLENQPNRNVRIPHLIYSFTLS
jgi:hypothetical protein